MGTTFFFFNDTATTEIYTLSLHDALPISKLSFKNTSAPLNPSTWDFGILYSLRAPPVIITTESASTASTLRFLNRSEEHTSELQSRQYLVCRLLLEKKQKMYRLLSPFYTS